MGGVFFFERGVWGRVDGGEVVGCVAYYGRVYDGGVVAFVVVGAGGRGREV